MRYMNKNSKSNLCLLLLGCICITLSGCAPKTETLTQSDTDSANTANTEERVEVTLPEAEIVYEDVDITIPAGLAGDEISDDHITNIDEETANITYSLSGNERGDLIHQLSEEITESISVILSDKEHYPNITSITPNDDYTEFTIALEGGTINSYEAMLVMSFYIVGDKYQIYNGISAEAAVTVVRYVDSATGDVISETDSTSMKSTG